MDSATAAPGGLSNPLLATGIDPRAGFAPPSGGGAPAGIFDLAQQSPLTAAAGPPRLFQGFDPLDERFFFRPRGSRLPELLDFDRIRGTGPGTGFSSVQPDEVVRFYQVLETQPGITPQEVETYAAVFALEGGPRLSADRGANAGIRAPVLAEAMKIDPNGGDPESDRDMWQAIQRKYPDVFDLVRRVGLDPTALTEGEIARLYQFYSDVIFLNVTGGAAAVLNSIGDDKARIVVFDAAFTHGRKTGSAAVQRAINEVLAGLTARQRDALGLPGPIQVDGLFGDQTLDAYTKLANSHLARQLRNAVADQRLGLGQEISARRIDYLR